VPIGQGLHKQYTSNFVNYTILDISSQFFNAGLNFAWKDLLWWNHAKKQFNRYFFIY